MSLLQNMPFSLCQLGPEQVDGVGNYYLQISASPGSNSPPATLYFLDTHAEIPSKVKWPDYFWIKQSQIDWFTNASQALRKVRAEIGDYESYRPLSLAFMHIPLPEYADESLAITGGQRREPTEGPSFNSQFYDALVAEGVVAVSCAHDHVNDFCALRPRRPKRSYEGSQLRAEAPELAGPWLCYGGAIGFGGYGSYDGKHYHRRARIWEIDTNTGRIRTWKRVEYSDERVDEMVLIERGKVVALR